MILPIVAYGDPVLRKKCSDIDMQYPNLQELIKNMFDTMYSSNGVGLAAPQIGLGIRLFVIDPSAFADDEDLSEAEKNILRNAKKVFINAEIIEENGDLWKYNEGCLSIPKIHEDVTRHENITIRYQDENGQQHTETFNGLLARVIQHEYDHIEGILFIDKLSAFKKKIIASKLNNIAKGNVKVKYRMRFFNASKKR